MPSLYGNTSTYTVTSTNVVTLYVGSTSTFSATTYSTNLQGLYGGYYSPLPTNAEQLIQLFDNNGNVQFFLDPATNSSTIAASVFQFSTATSAQLGNWIFSGNTTTNAVNQEFNFIANGHEWTMGSDGVMRLPTGSLNTGTTTAQFSDQYWLAPPNGAVTLVNNTGNNELIVDDTGVHVNTSRYATTSSAWSFNTDGTTQFPNYKFPAQHGTAGETLVDDGTGTLYWTTATGTAANQVFDFGTIVVPVSFTLDMGPIVI
jgi:hypothetical protein